MEPMALGSPGSPVQPSSSPGGNSAYLPGFLLGDTHAVSFLANFPNFESLEYLGYFLNCIFQCAAIKKGSYEPRVCSFRAPNTRQSQFSCIQLRHSRVQNQSAESNVRRKHQCQSASNGESRRRTAYKITLRKSGHKAVVRDFA